MSRNLGSWDRALQAEGAACSQGTEVSGKFKEPSSYAVGENGEGGRGQIWRDPRNTAESAFYPEGSEEPLNVPPRVLHQEKT